MVPLPGAVAVKTPVELMVPILPLTDQVNASGSALRGRWRYMAEAVRVAVEPGATLMEVTVLPPFCTEMESGVSMAWTVVEPLLPRRSAVTVTSQA